jgi:hypothetical protein
MIPNRAALRETVIWRLVRGALSNLVGTVQEAAPRMFQ